MGIEQSLITVEELEDAARAAYTNGRRDGYEDADTELSRIAVVNYDQGYEDGYRQAQEDMA